MLQQARLSKRESITVAELQGALQGAVAEPSNKSPSGATPAESEAEKISRRERMEKLGKVTLVCYNAMVALGNGASAALCLHQ